MGEDSRLTLPISIVLAGALIGAGLYFGLRQRAAAPTAPVGFGPAASSAAPVLLLPDAPPARSSLQSAIAAQVGAQLEKDRARIVQRCWRPSVAAAQQPSTVTLPLRFAFNADGTQHHHGVGQPSSPLRQDVADCVRAMKLTYRVEPPGDLAGAQIELMLP
ncbi:MAG: hypothetical protein KF718_04840 [Polyangiaceae bacterium]|nr:hypothetical protein [Polyangiaceae bacterium]